ncbi:UDP-N-acetylmuramoyl-tripeptide--D-alanyl-D-alanine ligase [Aeromicrobium sp. IC_218]|uniref:UDP-N-acetylmuramoyl-tripeptide--D-alanyl-D- alanine ligase n=1 Tax=Aeromicrobium sp. IC_218 TaxID=2545468 RepID=UPI0010391686|nr:UDP-N-acetylmuramoyl-tripeptide--D-alanyl-D-alanine ligase [Aeromicrobium sp. IC_218]TCI99753.1 UDP-N-acetylmuramoyl-tripeptide--D-alanyl-D-alanine ligase [Aeromicrobium sp. IC_218]
MIPLTLAELAETTGGTLHGDPATVVSGAPFVDSRAVEPGGLFVAVAGEHVDGHDYADAALAAGAAAVLASRPVDGPSVVVDDVVVALGRVARHVVDRLDDLKVVGVTGSAGKTSVKDLLAHLLAGFGPTVAPTGSFNNELGVPLTVLRADAGTRFLVVEMGARGIGHIRLLCDIAPPDVGVVLNVGSAHLGEFGSPERTAQAKGELVEALRPDGVAVLNADDARVAAMASRTVAPVLTFGGEGADVGVVDVALDASGEVDLVVAHQGRRRPAHLPLLGEHQAANAAAALAVVRALGLDVDQAVDALASARPASPMRMQREERADGLVVVNDAYNANPESAAAAVDALAAMGGEGATYAVLGEMLELGEGSVAAHRALGEHAVARGVDHVLAVGPGAAPVAEGAGDRGHAVPDTDAAVAWLRDRVGPGDAVLVKASRGSRLERVADALLTG